MGSNGVRALMGRKTANSPHEAEMYDISPIDDTGYLAEQERPNGESDDSIEFFVSGEPVPQGSTRSYYIKKLNRVVTTHGNRNTKEWQRRIRDEAERANEKRAVSFYSGDRNFGYSVAAVFIFQRPKSLPKKWKLNTKRPDLDKLIRALLDGLANYLLPDDSQVVHISASKRYGSIDEKPGVRIRVVRLRNSGQYEKSPSPKE